MKKIDGRLILNVPIELGTELSFLGSRLHHQWGEIGSDTTNSKCAVMRSQAHDYMSLTQVKIGQGLVLPFVMSIHMPTLMGHALNEFAETLSSGALAKELGMKP